MEPHLVAALEAAQKCEAELDAWWREQLVGAVLMPRHLELFAAARKLRADLQTIVTAG